MMMKLFWTLIAVYLVQLSFVAEARLVRSGGGGAETESNSDSYYIVPIANTNYLGLDTHFANSGRPIGTPAISQAGERLDIYATPTGECFDNTGNFFYGIDLGAIADDAERNAIIEQYFAEYPSGQRTACKWEFEEGEALDIEGFFEVLFADSIKQFTWTITSLTDSSNWHFSGTEISYTDTNGSTPVYLNAPMPSDMAVGEYRVDFSVSQQSGDNFRFYDLNVHETPVPDCDPIPNTDPEEFICGYAGLYSELTFSTSTSLTILARSPQDPSDVSAPEGMFALLGCLILLFRRQHRQR
jgi:hypothetical protein